ncbi:hypothetical protein [Mesorhizobium sp.]|uniref:hypothetical protein n=1 Tax=Mesorhizobium sp. TaxID=1871066 RepID=UPI0011FBD3EE|nr:hypothetical protein [Mesorhizobium sp.]TIN26411.1 MAG: hypothetical protein E5Y19_13635 [Mesorhizobium sp.]
MINRRDAILSFAGLISGKYSALERTVFDSRAVLEKATISTQRTFVRTGGFAVPGDGGYALYRRCAEAPSHLGFVQSADGAYWELAEDVVTPEMFGAMGDGSDQSAALGAMASYGRAKHHLRVQLTPGKTYAYTNPLFLTGIRDSLIIEGWGASFQNIRASTIGVDGQLANYECLVFPTLFYDHEQELLGTSSSQYVYGPLIETVAAGGTKITLQQGGSSADFVVGQRAIVYGFAMQENGFPNTSRYFEYVRITAVDGLELTVDQPLVFSYFSDWPVVARDALYQGPPRILSLCRAGFQETNYIEINGLHLKADPGWPNGAGGTIHRNGRIQAGNARRFVLNKVLGDGGMYVVTGGHFIDNGSSFRGQVEVDKFIEQAEFKSVDYGSFSQGTGCRRVIISAGSLIRKMNSIDALNRVEVRDSVIDGQAVETARIFNGTFGTPHSIFTNNRIRSYPKAVSMRGDSELSAAFNKVSSTRLDLATPLFTSKLLVRVIQPGTILYNEDGEAVFRVTVTPREAASRIFIDGEFLDGTFSDGDKLLCSRYPYVESFGNELFGPFAKQVSASEGTGTRPLLGIRRDQFADSGKWVYPSALRPLIANAPAVYFRPGLLVDVERITISVTRAYSGKTETVLLRFRRPGSKTAFAQVDLKATGQRTLDAIDKYGATGGDTLMGLDDDPIGIIEISTTAAVAYASRDEAAVWRLVLEGTQITD